MCDQSNFAPILKEDNATVKSHFSQLLYWWLEICDETDRMSQQKCKL